MPGSPSSWSHTFLSWEQTSTAGILLGTPPCTWLLAWALPPSPNCSLKQVRHCPSSFPLHSSGCLYWVVPGTRSDLWAWLMPTFPDRGRCFV